MQTVTRAHLSETIYTQVGLSRNKSADLLETVLERMATTLEAGRIGQDQWVRDLFCAPEGPQGGTQSEDRQGSAHPAASRPGVPPEPCV